MSRCRSALSALAAACIVALALAADASAEDDWIEYHELSGRMSVDSRWYPQSGAYPDQRAHASGLVVAPELYLEDAEGTSFNLEGLLRYDGADPQRSHADLREAYLLLFGEIGEDEWELRLGVDRVFWGVAESRHLVDIVNQTDLVEHPNEEAKLGQLMAHVTFSGEWGVAELFALPYHRKRTYPGLHGRLRTPLVVDNGRATYESAAKEWHLDLAARYSHSLDAFDFGVSVFDGTSREPALLPWVGPDDVVILPGGQVVAIPSLLFPHYEQITQVGLDVQMTADAWLLKLEAIRRTGARNSLGMEEDYTAFVAGAEYTLYAVFETEADLSLLAEWNRDERGERATNVFQNDVFVGARLGLNDVDDTDFVVGVLADADFGTRSFNAEFNTRLSDLWSLHVEAVAFQDVDMLDPTYVSRRDSFVEMNLTYSF